MFYAAVFNIIDLILCHECAFWRVICIAENSFIEYKFSQESFIKLPLIIFNILFQGNQLLSFIFPHQPINVALFRAKQINLLVNLLVHLRRKPHSKFNDLLYGKLLTYKSVPLMVLPLVHIIHFIVVVISLLFLF